MRVVFGRACCIWTCAFYLDVLLVWYPEGSERYLKDDSGREGVVSGSGCGVWKGFVVYGMGCDILNHIVGYMVYVCCKYP